MLTVCGLGVSSSGNSIKYPVNSLLGSVVGQKCTENMGTSNKDSKLYQVVDSIGNCIYHVALSPVIYPMPTMSTKMSF